MLLKVRKSVFSKTIHDTLMFEGDSMVLDISEFITFHEFRNRLEVKPIAGSNHQGYTVANVQADSLLRILSKKAGVDTWVLSANPEGYIATDSTGRDIDTNQSVFKDTFMVRVVKPNNHTDELKGLSLDVFPNPTVNKLHITAHGDHGNGRLYFFNHQGKLIHQQEIKEKAVIQTIEWPTGLYQGLFEGYRGGAHTFRVMRD